MAVADLHTKINLQYSSQLSYVSNRLSYSRRFSLRPLPQSHNSRICCSETSKYHPDKNANDPKAADIFKEATFSYNILSDPDKRRQYDTAGFEAVESESQELELDLSNLGAVNTMFAALFSKLRVPIKTTVSATVLEEALNGVVTIYIQEET